jgi:hypothetical protein
MKIYADYIFIILYINKISNFLPRFEYIKNYIGNTGENPANDNKNANEKSTIEYFSEFFKSFK